MRSFGLSSLITNPRALLKRVATLLLVVVVLIAASYWVGRGVTLPDDGEPIPVATESALAFVEKSTAAAQGAVGGVATLTVTDQELTSFLSIGSRLSELMQQVDGQEDLDRLQELRETEQLDGVELLERWEDLIEERSATGLGSLFDGDTFDLKLAIAEPEVRFTGEGRIVVRGTGKLAFVALPSRVVVAPRVEGGEIEFDFVEGQLGRVDLPEGLFDLVGGGLRQILLAGQDYAALDALEVQEGRVTFSGRLGS